jgi:multiple sugar transport system substrate-binding protein
VLPAHTNSAKVNTLVQSALDPLWKADADVAGVLGGVCKSIDSVLSQ